MGKTLDDYFSDWENSVFGFGYGSGEPHTIPALKRFLSTFSAGEGYDYRVIEKELGETVAWLLINTLCHWDILEYGSSPRFGWLTEKGKALKEFIDSKTAEQLIELTCRENDYTQCYPNACNCDQDGHEECSNPFWVTPTIDSHPEGG